MSGDTKQPLLPRLRFPEFRDEGEWEKPKLGSLGSFTGGGTPSKDNSSYWEGMNPWVSSSDISDDSIYEIKISRFISDQAIQETATKVVPENSILLVSRVGVGKLAITKEKICTSQDFTNFTPDKINLVFLAYSLKIMKDKFLSFNQGMAIKGFTKEDVSSLEVPLPIEPREQQKIADCLSSLDELITAETQKLDTLKTHKKGLLQQLFPREGETVPRLRFPEFRGTGDWETAPMGSLLVKNPEYGINAPAAPYSEDLPTYLRITDIDEDGRFLCKTKVSVDIVATDDNYLEPGDIVLARTGASVGKSYRYQKEDGRLVFAGFLIRVRPAPKKVSPVFLANFFTTQQYWDWVAVTSARSGQPGINGVEYSSLPVPVPSHEAHGNALLEQQRIADCLSSLDDLITAQNKKIDALKAHKKGLMQQLFPVLDEVSA